MFNHVALISETEQVPNWELQIVAAALQIQIARDFRPIWGIEATIAAFDSLDDVPTGYWPITIRDDIGYDAAGIHLDKNKRPFGLVQTSNRWAMTVSHELLEILADPFGNRMYSAQSIDEDQGVVQYLIEVCDPSEAEEYGYQINGVWLSDFYTPDYFLPRPSNSVRYSFTGAIEAPRTILPGGYISWLDPSTDEWWQQTWFHGDEPIYRNLGILDTAQQSPRTAIDIATQGSRKDRTSFVGLPNDHKILVNQKRVYKNMNSVKGKQAKEWRTLIDTFTTTP